MGYGDHWQGPQPLPRPPCVAAAKDFRRLCAALDIPLRDPNGGGGWPTSSSAIQRVLGCGIDWGED